LAKSDAQDIVAEWQRLMRRWELVYADYTTGQSGITMDDAAIERVQLNLIQIKEQIDKLISQSSQTRAASPDQLQFAVIKTKINRLLEEMAKARAEPSAGEPKTQPAPPTRNGR
jgi:hypothetical protein